MAFDMGFDFRNTSGFVTDPAYGVPVLGEAYPHTYTNGNGLSINAGWDGVMNKVDRTNTNDPRIAGINFVGTPSSRTFTIDLSSGSAPGAGTYTIDLAVGDAGGSDAEFFTLYDNVTTLIDGTNGGAGYTTLNGHYIDATLADVTATTTWTGATVSKTFASTTVNMSIGNATIGFATRIAHFRLTLATVASRKNDFFPFFVPGLLSTPS